MLKRWIIGAEVLCLVFALVSGSLFVRTQAAAASQIQAEIDALKQREEQIAEELHSLESQIAAHNDEVEEMIGQKNLLDQQIALLQEQIDLNNEQIQAYRAQIAESQTQLEETEATRTELHEKYKKRIRAIEEQGGMRFWSVLFQANSFSDFLDRMAIIQEISASDQRRLAQLQEIETELTNTRESLITQQEQLDETCLELQEKESLLQQKREEADAILQGLLEKGREYELLLAQSEQAQDELMKQLAEKETEYDALAKQEIEDNNSDIQNGQWVVPVPYYTLTSPFGLRIHPILGIERMHNGVDMACAENTPIYAARSGVVTVTDYQENGAGNYVQIDHGDGYRSIYMHMIRFVVSPGQQVSAGEIIGYVGSTGLSDGNHLHFGISYNGVYVNPMEYLP